MKRTSILFGILSSIALPQVVAAQSSDFTIDGSISVGNYWSDTGNDALYDGWVDGSYQFANVGGGSIGIDVGLELFGSIESGPGNINHAYYALTYQGGFGKVSIGLPRSAYDQTGPSDRNSIASSPIVGAIPMLTHSIVDVALATDTNLYGAAFEGQTGNASYRLSYHSVNETGSAADIIAVGGEYQFGSMTASVAVESVKATGGNLQHYKVGLEGTAGAIDYGISYAGGDSFLIPDLTTISAFGNYSINDRISVGLDIKRFESAGGHSTISSLGAVYKVSDQFDVEANYSNIDDGGLVSLAGIAATYNF